MAGALHSAVFNTARRTREQLLFWLTPMVAGYAIMEWAIEKYVICFIAPARTFGRFKKEGRKGRQVLERKCLLVVF